MYVRAISSPTKKLSGWWFQIFFFFIFFLLFFFLFKVGLETPSSRDLERAEFSGGMSSVTPWGDSGEHPQWGVNCQALCHGQKVSFVLDIITVDGDANNIVGIMFPGRVVARLSGPFEWDPQWFSITVLDGCYDGKMCGVHQFKVQTAQQILGHRIVTRDTIFNVVETCAGMGVSTFGLERAGLKVIAANDLSGPLMEAYQVMHPEVKAIHGDIWSSKTLGDLHAVAAGAAILAAGFSCQPFSSGGRQLGGLDDRSSTLTGVLRASLLLRKPVVILECVGAAGSNRFVRAQVESFCLQCGYRMTERVLKLEDVWISKRERWWAVLSVAAFGQFTLQDFLPGSYPSCVADLIPRPMSMPDDEFDQLVIGVEEHQQLLKYSDPMQMILPHKTKCPTALHSWGSQVRACPCGCRPPFADSTLMARGIFGVFLPVEGATEIGDDQFQKLRHVHPSELAILTGAPIPAQWHPSMRLCLCGLGQQASPMQSLWVAGQVRRLLDFLLGIHPVFDYPSELRALMEVVIHQSRMLFVESPSTSPVSLDEDMIPVPNLCGLGSDTLEAVPSWVSTIHQGGPSSFTLHFEETRQCEVVQVSNANATVGNLRAAEVHINPLVDLWDIVDCGTGKVLCSEDLVVGKSLLLRPVGMKALGELPMSVSPTAGSGADVETEQGRFKLDAEVSPTVPFTIEVGREEGVDSVMIQHDPLVALSPEQLLDLELPSIGSQEVFHALQRQMIPAVTRDQLLGIQQTLWADDEIRWHLNDIISKAKSPGWVMLDPLIASNALYKRLAAVIVRWFSDLGFRPHGIVSCVVVDGHWLPLVWQWTSSQLTCRSWDGRRDQPLNLSALHEAIALAVGARTWTTHILHRGFPVHEACGVCACCSVCGLGVEGQDVA